MRKIGTNTLKNTILAVTASLGVAGCAAPTQETRGNVRDELLVCIRAPYASPKELPALDKKTGDALIPLTSSRPNASRNTEGGGYERCSEMHPLHMEFKSLQGEFWQLDMELKHALEFNFTESLYLDIANQQEAVQMIERKIAKLQLLHLEFIRIKEKIDNFGIHREKFGLDIEVKKAIIDSEKGIQELKGLLKELGKQVPS